MIKNKKILIVGAGGFIGGHLVKKLLNVSPVFLFKPQCSKSKLYNLSIYLLFIIPNHGARLRANGKAFIIIGTKVVPL